MGAPGGTALPRVGRLGGGAEAKRRNADLDLADVAFGAGPGDDAADPLPGAAPLLDTQTANQAVTLNTRMVEELPNVARNLYSLALSTAGVTYAQPWMRANVGTVRSSFPGS